MTQFQRKKIISQKSGNSGLSPVDEARLVTLEDNEYKITYFTEISSTTGTITIPTGATILLNQLQGGIDAYVSVIENGQPNGEFPRTSGGVTVDVSSFDALGNYTIDGTPSGYPVALIYVLKIKAKDYSNLTVANILDLEDNPQLEDRVDRLQSTGVIDGVGVSINADTTKFDIQVRGWIIDPDTFAPEYINVNLTAQSVTNLSQKITYVRVETGGTVIQQAAPSTTEQLYSSLGEFVLVHTNGTSLNAVNNYPNRVSEIGVQLHSFMRNVGILNLSGNIISANGANLKLNKSSGVMSRVGVGNSDTDNPNELGLAALTAPNTIRLRTQTGTETANTDVIDTVNYDLNGVVTALPTAADWQVYRVNVFSSNLLRLQYGQFIYSSMSQAEASIQSEAFVIETNIRENGLLIGYIIVRRGTTNLTDANRAKFIPANKFGSGPTSGGVIPTLQAVIDISGQPQGTMTDATGSLQINSTMASDASRLFEWMFGGTATAWITGAGDFFSNSFKILGTAGAGFFDMAAQSSDASAPAASIRRLFADANKRLSSVDDGGQIIKYAAYIVRNTTTTSALTGTTGNTLLVGDLIKANTVMVGDFLKYHQRQVYVGTAGVKTMRAYFNTSNSLSGATIFLTFNATAASLYKDLGRHLVVKSATVTEVNSATNNLIASPYDNGTLINSNINIDWTVDQYVISACQLASAADSAVNSYQTLER
jgi:hypothetical protein